MMKIKKKGNNSRSNPLLVVNDDDDDYANNNNNNNSGILKQMQNQQGNDNDDSTSAAIDRVGCFGHMIILSLPILASILLLSFLIVLLRFDKQNQQANYQQEQEQEQEDQAEDQAENDDQVAEDGDANYNDYITDEVESYYGSIQSRTISIIMSEYEPFMQLVVLVSLGALLTCIVTVARNIQIYIYQKRNPSTTYTINKILNVFATIVNIISYVGLVITVAIKSDQNKIVHYIGASIFFAGTGLYSILHSYLLWTQKQYPILIKLWFTLFSIIISICSIVFGFSVLSVEGGLSSLSEEEAEATLLPQYEWAAVITTSISIGFYTILFYIDPVDDEIRDFFFCHRRGCCC
jgi:hypothetical protein